MNKQMIKTTGILIILIALIIGGCQKESTTTTAIVPGDSNTSEGSIVIGDKTFEGLNGIIDGFMATSGLKSAAIGSCPSITATLSNSFPIAITIDWGATGCTGAEDGIARSGKVIASLSGLMNVTNSVATFTFADFVNNGNKITGVHRITYKGLNPVNNWPRYAVFTEAKIEFPDKKFITYRAEYIRLQSEGSATLAVADDVWRIEGSSSGTTRGGTSWTASYPSAVVKKSSCQWFSSGSVLVTPLGEVPRTINFGDGTCDNKATLTIGDKITIINL
jgi:hypothetical protein